MTQSYEAFYSFADGGAPQSARTSLAPKQAVKDFFRLFFADGIERYQVWQELPDGSEIAVEMSAQEFRPSDDEFMANHLLSYACMEGDFANSSSSGRALRQLSFWLGVDPTHGTRIGGFQLVADVLLTNKQPVQWVVRSASYRMEAMTVCQWSGQWERLSRMSAMPDGSLVVTDVFAAAMRDKATGLAVHVATESFVGVWIFSAKDYAASELVEAFENNGPEADAWTSGPAPIARRSLVETDTRPYLIVPHSALRQYQGKNQGDMPWAVVEIINHTDKDLPNVWRA